jgi:hypothetical protein
MEPTAKRYCSLWNHSGRVYSQNGEDGILYFLLQWLGKETGIAVEMCSGNARECNISNLVIHHGFQGFFFDGDYHKTQQARHFLTSSSVSPEQGIVIHAWISINNVEALFRKYSIPRRVDVLSLDMDGVDFWILQTLFEKQLSRPRICVVEYQDILGPDKSLTVPYMEEFCAWDYDCHLGPNYAGASLEAFRRLFQKYGYQCMGCEPQGFNAFFVLEEELEMCPRCPFSIQSLFEIPKVKEGMQKRFPRTRGLPWIAIDEDGNSLPQTSG